MKLETTDQTYANVNKIIIFGNDINKLSSNIIKNVIQISEKLNESLDIDIKTLKNCVRKSAVLFFYH